MGWAGLLFLFLLPFFALGAPTPPHGSIEEDLSVEKKTIGLDLYAWGYTNPFSRWNGRTATASGEEGDPIQIVHQLTLHAPAYGPFDFEITPQIVLQPNEGDRLHLLDPSIGFEGTLVDRGGFKYWLRVETLIPVTQTSREEGMILGPQLVQNFEYAIPRLRLTAELSITPTLSLYSDGTSVGEMYVSPRLYYHLNDSWALLTLLETTLASEKGSEPWNLAAGDVSLGLGMKYTSLGGDGMWVQPFLNVFPGGDVASNAHLGLFFGGPLL